MGRLTEAQTKLHAALVHVFDEPVIVDDDTVLAFGGDRVHRSTPPTVAAPAVWLEQCRGSIRASNAGARLDVATFPVILVYDGSDRAQADGVTQLLERAWDWARTVGDPTDWEPRPLDVGGPTLRSYEMSVDMRIGASTLCGSPAMIKEAVSG